ncbi:hypothetical protein GCM10027422_10860 [Hymenobacter arcticus]
MAEPLEYVVNGALLQCSQGTVPMPFQTLPRTTKVGGLLAGNELDVLSIINVPSFIICQKLTQMAGGTPTPCVPAPTPWQYTYPVRVGGGNALLVRSCSTCPTGQGKIEFLTSGQLPIPPGVSQDLADLQEASEEALAESKEEQAQADREKNAVGEAGFWEGMIPIWGSGRDLINAVQTGDKVGVALSAAFLVWDVASVVAGAVSFGTATAAMMGAKAGVRAAIKAGAKAALRGGEKKLAAVVARSSALKTGVKAGLKYFGENGLRKCVTACFVAGTPIAMEHGLKPIEEVSIGDEVWAWDEQSGRLALKRVLRTKQQVADATIRLRVGAEYITTTPEHPFRTADGWQLAGDLRVGDQVLRSDKQLMPVLDITHQLDEECTVYNFEVAEWATYLVSRWLLVVHNARVCLRGLTDEAIKAIRVGMLEGGYRPKFRKGVVDDVWKNAQDADGRVFCPNSKKELFWDKSKVDGKVKSRTDQWHMGHKTGHEYKDLAKDYKKGRISWKNLLDEYNDVNHYQPEDPIANVSHAFEAH